MRTYVALFDRRFQGSFHWALSLSEGDPVGTLPTFHITNFDIADPWRTAHGPIDLAHDERLVGCVALPEIEDAVEDIAEFIGQYDSAQGDSVTEGNVPRSCSWWLIRTVQDMVQAGVLEMDTRGFYQRILARGVQLQSGQGVLRAGVRVLDY
ncbi:hypothetical protein EW146_g2374 [Bondarzewia mesenterica]|uniref:Uncharacterized protein n=1 Tax=Bondarzewia mesenterica TaxID=1095465 RepID=A0A4S4M369_9AGAM|nr:hypothetical protein EW146_g2374 [Bondarzewia mesenterica]